MASELLERVMYNGQFQVTHNPNARGRSPRYLVNGTGKPKGVTTILGQTLNKDLMAWAVDCCVEYLKAKLPVVTEADLLEGAKEYTRRRDSGASTGTEAHALVEGFLKTWGQADIEHVEPGHSQEALNAAYAFMTWFKEAQPEIINVEEVVYSAKYAYAGCYDAMLRIGDKVMLSDYKTTNASRKAPNGVYSENFVQLGAYAQAHEEQREYELANGGTDLLPIDDLVVISCQKNGKLTIVTASQLGLSVTDCREMFIKVVSIFNFMKSTTALLGGR